MRLRSTVVVLIVLAVWVSVASAIDKRFVMSWRNSAGNVVGTDKEVVTWWISWAINPIQSNGFDQRNLDTVDADPSRLFGNHEVPLTGLQVGDDFHVAIQGCNALGVCSEWTNDVVVTVPIEPAPGEPDPTKPDRAEIVYIMMHPLQ